MDRPSTARDQVENIGAIQIWDPNDQVTDIADELPAGYTDKDIYIIMLERTKALRELQKKLKRSAMFLTGGDGILWALKNVPHHIGMRFDAHGFGLKDDPAVLLDKILTKGISVDKTLYSMSFIEGGQGAGAFGADHPITSGGIVIVSDYGKKLTQDGIKYVIVDESYNRVISLLRKKYPQVQIVPWNEAPKVLIEASNKKEGTDIQAAEANPDTAYYVRAVRRMFESVVPIPSAHSVSEGEGADDVW